MTNLEVTLVMNGIINTPHMIVANGELSRNILMDTVYKGILPTEKECDIISESIHELMELAKAQACGKLG